MKRDIILCFLIVSISFIAVSGCCPECNKQKTENSQEITQSRVVIITEEQEVIINAETADTDEERKTGLMNRTYLPEDSGMLFVFGESGKYGFWMKNTLISLDMIFLKDDESSNYTIVDIIENAQPCVSEPCEVYKPVQEADIVLEVNAGFAAEKNIKTGDRVMI
ncbi:MAG: DUF192 domain-containing protein [Nanoarchaeota archaeon]|nr:DUF192 domain-containing protein [Nanoarchaeota archaeon]